jgi:hypothetical protein
VTASPRPERGVEVWNDGYQKASVDVKEDCCRRAILLSWVGDIDVDVSVRRCLVRECFGSVSA